MQPDAELRLRRATNRFRRRRPGRQHRGARHHAFGVRREDAFVEPRVETEIVRVDDQPKTHEPAAFREGNAVTSRGKRTGRAGGRGFFTSPYSEPSSRMIFAITDGLANVETPRVRGK